MKYKSQLRYKPDPVVLKLLQIPQNGQDVSRRGAIARTVALWREFFLWHNAVLQREKHQQSFQF